MSQSLRPGGDAGREELARRALILFVNFFLIILAYYQVKSASRSLLIEYWGAGKLPYVWIVSALVLGSFIGVYHRLVERHSRLRVVLGSLLAFMALLVAFRLLLALGSGTGAAWAAFGFYIFVDIFSVILVEQFWSLANTVNEAGDGKRSYWFVGSGGLLGGVAGGGTAALLLEWTPMTTPDLLLSCAVLLGVTLALNLMMGRMGLYAETGGGGRRVIESGGWRALAGNRYILLIAAGLFCAQLAQPVVDYQFLSAVEAAYPVMDDRTVFIGGFFGLLGIVALGVNLVLTPVIHRYLGFIAGMLVQPIALAVFTFGFMAQPVLWVASAMKISDRGLSYSINRASKEQLYIPIDPVHTYQAKAWIDMLGYRLFKVAGSAAVLLLTQWLPLGVGPGQLGRPGGIGPA
jgi:AAA family ATP:ADP antiporter